MILFPVKAFLEMIGKERKTSDKWDLRLPDLQNISPSEVRQIHDWILERITDLSSGVSFWAFRISQHMPLSTAFTQCSCASFHSCASIVATLLSLCWWTYTTLVLPWIDILQVKEVKSSADMLTLSQDGEALTITKGFLETLQVCNPACRRSKSLCPLYDGCILDDSQGLSLAETPRNILQTVHFEELMSTQPELCVQAKSCPLSDHPQPTSAQPPKKSLHVSTLP